MTVEALRLEAKNFARMLDDAPALRARIEITAAARLEPALQDSG